MPREKPPYAIEVGRQMRKARKQAGLTQGELAAAIGIEEGRYGNYERGWVLAPTDVIIKLRERLHRPADYFLGYEVLPGLRPDERELLQHYRELPQVSKDSLLRVARSLDKPTGDEGDATAQSES